jgi:hypothetical protein
MQEKGSKKDPTKVKCPGFNDLKMNKKGYERGKIKR